MYIYETHIQTFGTYLFFISYSETYQLKFNKIWINVLKFVKAKGFES